MVCVTALFYGMSAQAQSECYGTTANGRLTEGVKLPSSGSNFVSYSTIAELAGRTYVHSAVHDIVMAAYHALAISHPTKVYKYAETGLEEGGRFRPHKTHQNGLSIDFMTPMKTQNNQSVHLPTHAFNRFGYDIELDDKGRIDDLSIDYDAMAAHIVALDKSARTNGFKLWRVIFDPTLQAPLFQTEYADYLREKVQFSKKRSWVRHDEHYHIDFEIPCNTL